MRRLHATLLLVLLVALPAAAWTDAGHEVVAAIAWQEMSPAVRRAATDLLLQAPPSSGIPELAPVTAGDERGRRLFLAASTWPDLVKRDAALGRYDHPGWHYADHFWRSGPDGAPRPVPGLAPAAVNAVERLEVFTARLRDPAAPAEERALALAWVLHLVADLHQPLHVSARVTDQPDERRGDKGGNTFRLHDDLSLHAWWDTLPERARRRRFWEGRGHWVDRLARQLAGAAAANGVGAPADDFDGWVRESLRVAQGRVYVGIERGRRPSSAYRRTAADVADRRLALAGRRLAALLESVLPAAGER